MFIYLSTHTHTQWYKSQKLLLCICLFFYSRLYKITLLFMTLVMFCQIYTSLMFSPPSQIPEFDNLYLDMNGIIHQCSHPNDEDVHFRISEEKIFADIFHYLEVLFRIIKPRKVFFMAVDGVAPRAKMNQQRGRRFRYSKRPSKRFLFDVFWHILI